MHICTLFPLLSYYILIKSLVFACFPNFAEVPWRVASIDTQGTKCCRPFVHGGR